jgi:hypothetical protein
MSNVVVRIRPRVRDGILLAFLALFLLALGVSYLVFGVASLADRIFGFSFTVLLGSMMALVIARPLVSITSEQVRFRWFAFRRASETVSRVLIVGIDVREGPAPFGSAGATLQAVGQGGKVLVSLPSRQPGWLGGGPWSAESVERLARALAL